jgi:CBS domain-containing protein
MLQSTVREALAAKKTQTTIWSIHPKDSVYNAIKVMAMQNIGALLVIDEKKIVGIITERDYARKVILANRSSKDTHVFEIMNTDVYAVSPETTVDQCMGIMTEKKVRHLPVISYGRLVGLISQGDIVKSMLSDKEFLIDQLTVYITGSHDTGIPLVDTETNKDLKRAYY